MSQPWQLQDPNQGGPVKMFDPNQFQPNTAESTQNVGTPHHHHQQNGPHHQQQNGQMYGHQESNMPATSNESWDQAWGQTNWEDGWNNDGQWANNTQQVPQQQVSPQSTQSAEMTNFSQHPGWEQQAWQQQQGYGQQYAEPHMQAYSAQPGLDSSQGRHAEAPSVDSSGGTSGFYPMGGLQAILDQSANVPGGQPQSVANQFQEIPLDGQPDTSSTLESTVTRSEPKKEIPHTNSFSNMPYEPSPFDDIGSSTSLNKSSDSAGVIAAPQLGASSNRDSSFAGDSVKFIIGSQPGSVSNSGTQSPYPQTDSPGMNASGLQQEQVMPPQPQLFNQGPADTGVQSHNSHVPQEEVHPGQLQTEHANVIAQATSSVPDRPPSTSSCASSHHSSHHGSAVSDSLPGQIPKHEGPSSVHSTQSSDSAHVENTPPLKHEDPMIGAVASSSEHHQRSYSGQSARSVDSLSLSQSLQSSVGSLQIAESLQDSANSATFPQSGTSQLSENMNTAVAQGCAVMTGPPPMPMSTASQEEGNPFRRTDAGLAQAHPKIPDIQPTQTHPLPVDQMPQGVEMPVEQPNALPRQSSNDQPAEQSLSNVQPVVPQNASIAAKAACAVTHPEQLVTPEDAQPAGPAPPASIPIASAAISSVPTSLPLGVVENVRMVASSPVVSHPGSPFKPLPKLSSPNTDKSVHSEPAADGSSAGPAAQGINSLQSPGASGPGPVGQPPQAQPGNNPSTAAGYHMYQANVPSDQSLAVDGNAQLHMNSLPGMPVGQVQHTSLIPGAVHESSQSNVSQEVNRTVQQTYPIQATNQVTTVPSGQNQVNQQTSAVPSQMQTQANPGQQQQQQAGPSGPQVVGVPNPSAQQPSSNPEHHVHSGVSGVPGALGGHNPQPNVPNVSQPQNMGAPRQQETSTPQSLSQTSSQLELESLASVTLPSNLMDNTRDAELTNIDQQREQEARNQQDYRNDSRDSRDRRYDDRDRRYDDRRYDERDRRYDDRRYDDRDRRYDDRYRRDDPRYRPSSRGPPEDDRYRDPYRPSSRQGYPEDRPRSTQGYPDDRPRSRQGYPDERYDRPRSRQGYPDDPRYGRPGSRQGYPDDPRDRNREVPYRDRYRPSSRQGYPGKSYISD